MSVPNVVKFRYILGTKLGIKLGKELGISVLKIGTLFIAYAKLQLVFSGHSLFVTCPKLKHPAPSLHITILFTVLNLAGFPFSSEICNPTGNNTIKNVRIK